MSKNQLHFIKISYFLSLSILIHFLVLFSMPKQLLNHSTPPLVDSSSSLMVKMIPPAAKKPTSTMSSPLANNQLSQSAVATETSQSISAPVEKPQPRDKDKEVVKQKSLKSIPARQTKPKPPSIKKIATENKKPRKPRPQLKKAAKKRVKETSALSTLSTSSRDLTSLRSPQDKSPPVKSYSAQNQLKFTQSPPIQTIQNKSEPEQSIPAASGQTGQNRSVALSSTEKSRFANPDTPSPTSSTASTANNLPVTNSEPSITPVQFKANYLHNPQPRYPRLSRRLGEQGKVHLKVQVNPQGQPVVVNIQQSSGFERLDRVAKETVQNWQFIPAKRGNQAIQSWVVVPIHFRLN